MIRTANIEDIPRMVELGAMFHGSTAIKDVIPYDPLSMATMIISMIGDPSRVVLVLEKDGLIVGGIGGFCEPIYFNKSFLSAQQLFWFVDPAHRSLKSLKLLDAFCDWADGIGAEITWTAAKIDVNHAGMCKMLARKRFKQLDTTFFKEA